MDSYENIVEAQHRFFQTGATRPLKWRLNALKKLRHAIIRNEAAILDALQKDLGKNDFEAYASETGIVLGEIRNAEKLARKYTSSNRIRTPLFLWPSRSSVLFEPLGVCLIIAPWNYPFQLALAPLVDALAAGNCAVVKPSERSVHTAAVIAQLLSETFSPEYVKTIIADRKDSARLLKQPFDKLFFTGSKAVGQIVYREAAEKMVPVTLELGGKNPCIVMNDANIKAAARRIVWGKFYNAGQTCVAPDYLLVHNDIAFDLLLALQTEITRQLGDDPRLCPYYGRLIDNIHLNRMTELLTDTMQVCGGDFDAETNYLAPTIVSDINWDHPLMADEIFGPILPVITFDSLDDALGKVQEIPKSLALYVFTRSSTTRRKVIQTMRYGGGCINDTLVHFSSPYLSVGGVAASGIGQYRGLDGYRAFSNTKSIVQTPHFPDLMLRYPPFAPWKTRLLKRLMK